MFLAVVRSRPARITDMPRQLLFSQRPAEGFLVNASLIGHLVRRYLIGGRSRSHVLAAESPDGSRALLFFGNPTPLTAPWGSRCISETASSHDENWIGGDRGKTASQRSTKFADSSRRIPSPVRLMKSCHFISAYKIPLGYWKEGSRPDLRRNERTRSASPSANAAKQIAKTK